MIGTTDGFSLYLGQPTADPELRRRLSFFLLGAQSFVDNYFGYPIELGTHSCILDGDGSQLIFVPWFPINSISKIEYFDESDFVWINYIDEDAEIKYRMNSQTGQVKIVGSKFFNGFQNIQINYSHGYDFTVTPLDFKLNGLVMVIYEVATLFQDNPGLLSFQSVDSGAISKSRYSFKIIICEK